jgi:nitrogen fixation-related uncharacterized protein
VIAISVAIFTEERSRAIQQNAEVSAAVNALSNRSTGRSRSRSKMRRSGGRQAEDSSKLAIYVGVACAAVFVVLLIMFWPQKAARPAQTRKPAHSALEDIRQRKPRGTPTPSRRVSPPSNKKLSSQRRFFDSEMHQRMKSIPARPGASEDAGGYIAQDHDYTDH